MTDPDTTTPATSTDDLGPRAVVGGRTVTALVVLVVLDLLLRHVGGFGQWTVNQASERYGWVMLPDQSAWSRDLTVPEQINADGFRDRAWEPPVRAADGTWQKDDGVLRVALVGNSMTFGTSVPIEATWGRILEDLLAEQLAARGDDRRVLVMNFAVQGYVFEQMARVYEDKIRPWRPDLLVVPFHPHDIMPMRPAQDDVDYDFRHLVLRTATFDMLDEHVIDHWIPPLPVPKEARQERKAWNDLDRAVTEQPFARDQKEHWDETMERMEGVLADVEADGGHLVLVSLPRWRRFFQEGMLGAESKWGSWAWERRPRVAHVFPRPRFEPSMEALVAEIRANGIAAETTHDLSTLSWTDASGATRTGTELELAKTSPYLLDDTGHYTEVGHRLLAEAVAVALAEQGWVER